jgi:multicomponent Na+:H+ antiporter subunit D
MPSLLILIPLFGIILLNLPIRKISMRMAFWFAVFVFFAQILIAIFHYPVFWAQDARFIHFFHVGLAVDYLGVIMLLCIGIVSLASLLVGRYTIFDEKERFRFINLLMIAGIGMNGVVMVRDIFSMYVFLEVMAVATFVLIAFNKDLESLEGSFKYIVLSAVATVLMLTAIALFLFISAGTTFSAIRDGLAQYGKSRVIIFAVGLFICGIFIKGGFVPFHGWLPDAYTSAPSSISVLLAGIVAKVAGVYTLLRLVASVFGFDGRVKTVLLIIGALSVIIGALAALRQKNMKRMLAYSSISQMGYIVLGLGAGSGLGIVGAIFHIFNHAIFKSLLFVNAAAVERQVGTNNMNKMGGISSRMPVTGVTSLIGMLSTCGLPPFAGFWSKLIIVVALWQSADYVYAAIAVLASVITLAYFLSMQRRVFFGELAKGMDDLKEANFGISLSAIVLAFITTGVGILFPAVFTKLILPAKDIFIR